MLINYLGIIQSVINIIFKVGMLKPRVHENSAYVVLSAKTFTSAVVLCARGSCQRKNCSERETSQNRAYERHNYLIL